MVQAAKLRTYRNHVLNQDPLYLVRRISHGLAGWLTFTDVGWRHRVLSEYYLYPPIFEMALGRKWLIRPQRPTVRTEGQVGASKTVDFIMLKNSRTVEKSVGGKVKQEKLPRAFVAVELKFSKGKSLFPSTYVEDCLQLGKLTPASISLPIYTKFHCCFMIAGDTKSMSSLTKKDVKNNSRQRLIEQLRRIFQQDAGRVSADGWYCESAESLSHGSYRVAVMLRHRWWKQLEVKVSESAPREPES